MQTNNIIRVIARTVNYAKRIAHLGFSIDCRIHVIMLFCCLNCWHLLHTDPDFLSKNASVPLSVCVCPFPDCHANFFYNIDHISFLFISLLWRWFLKNLAYLLLCRAIASPCPRKPIRWLLAFSPRTICLNIIQVELIWIGFILPVVHVIVLRIVHKNH